MAHETTTKQNIATTTQPSALHIFDVPRANKMLTWLGGRHGAAMRFGFAKVRDFPSQWGSCRRLSCRVVGAAPQIRSQNDWHVQQMGFRAHQARSRQSRAFAAQLSPARQVWRRGSAKEIGMTSLLAARDSSALDP